MEASHSTDTEDLATDSPQNSTPITDGSEAAGCVKEGFEQLEGGGLPVQHDTELGTVIFHPDYLAVPGPRPGMDNNSVTGTQRLADGPNPEALGMVGYLTARVHLFDHVLMRDLGI